MSDPAPSAIVLAGPNGAGKTTAARTLLAEKLQLMTFVNADVIAQGLAGFDPVATWRDGQVVWLQPAEVFALLGHKPENGDGERGAAPTNLDGTITLYRAN